MSFGQLPSPAQDIAQNNKINAVWFNYLRGLDRFVRAKVGDIFQLNAATTSVASLNIPAGTAPTAPNNGDIWFDGTDIKMQIGGVTKTFTLT